MNERFKFRPGWIRPASVIPADFSTVSRGWVNATDSPTRTVLLAVWVRSAALGLCGKLIGGQVGISGELPINLLSLLAKRFLKERAECRPVTFPGRS